MHFVKFKSYLLILFISLFPLLAVAEFVDVLIIAGQSNAFGAADKENLTAAENQEQDNIFIIKADGASFDKLNPTLNGTHLLNNNQKHSIESVLQSLVPSNKELYIVKAAKSGTDIESLLEGSDTFTELQTRYNGAVTALQAEGNTIGNTIVWWAQGEADSNSPAKIANYSSRYDLLIASFRSLMGNDIKIVNNEIYQDYAGDASAINSILHDKAANDPNIFVLANTAYEAKPDNSHFTTASLRLVADYVYRLISVGDFIVANDDIAVVDRNTTTSVDVLENDSINGAITIISTEGAGTASIVDNEINFIAADTAGETAVSYTLTKNTGSGVTDTADLIITTSNQDGSTSNTTTMTGWRLVINSNQSGTTGTTIAETNLPGNNVTGTSQQGESAVSSAVDNDLGSAWFSSKSASFPQNMTVLLDASTTIPNVFEIATHHENPEFSPRDFKIEVTNDVPPSIDSTWETIWDIQDQTGWIGGETRSFDKPSDPADTAVTQLLESIGQASIDHSSISLGESDYIILDINNVDLSSLTTYNQIIEHSNTFSNPATTLEVQEMVDGLANASVSVVEISDNANTSLNITYNTTGSTVFSSLRITAGNSGDETAYLDTNVDNPHESTGQVILSDLPLDDSDVIIKVQSLIGSQVILEDSTTFNSKDPVDFFPATMTGWRLEITSNQSGTNGVTIADTNLPGTNVTSTSHQVNSVAFLAVNNNVDNAWFSSQSESFPQSLTVMLDSSASIPNLLQITTHPSNPDFSPENFKLEITNDVPPSENSTWITIWDVQNQTGWVAGETRSFEKSSVPLDNNISTLLSNIGQASFDHSDISISEANYAVLGVTDVTLTNLSIYNAIIKNSSFFSNPATLTEVQNMINKLAIANVILDQVNNSSEESTSISYNLIGADLFTSLTIKAGNSGNDTAYLDTQGVDPIEGEGQFDITGLPVDETNIIVSIQAFIGDIASKESSTTFLSGVTSNEDATNIIPILFLLLLEE
ncbi:MAG: sialate O-acetylesterase [Cocleimonas sp.]